MFPAKLQIETKQISGRFMLEWQYFFFHLTVSVRRQYKKKDLNFYCKFKGSSFFLVVNRIKILAFNRLILN